MERLERKQTEKMKKNNISGEKTASDRDQHQLDRDQAKVREFEINKGSRSASLTDRDQDTRLR